MSPSNRPVTEINMLAAAKVKSLGKVTGQAVLFDSLNSRSTLKGDVSSKTTTRSPADTSAAATGTRKAQSKIIKSATNGPILLRTALESPWKKYEKMYEIELGGQVEVAIRKASPVELVHVRAFSTEAAAKTLHLFRQLQHQNIVAPLEAFTTDKGLYIILEHMPLSLEQVVRSPAYPDERQLAAILGQIVNGLAYLAKEGYEHGSLTCSNILLSLDGNVKIANQECCHVTSVPKGKPRDIKSISSITMELMQKYVKEDGATGIDDLHRWRSSPDALGFLSATTSATSTAELLKHPLLARPWQKESLIGIISLAQVCMRGRYKYTPRE